MAKSSIADLDKFKADFRQSVADSLISESPDLDGLISESNVVVNNISDVSRRRIVLASGLSVDYTITAYHVEYSSLNGVANSTLSSPSFASYLKNNTGYQFTGVSALVVVNLSPTGSPTYAPSIAPTKAPAVPSAVKSSNSLTAGAIAGIVIGCCVAMALLGGGVYYIYYERRRVAERQMSYIYPSEAENLPPGTSAAASSSFPYSYPIYRRASASASASIPVPMNQEQSGDGLSSLVEEGTTMRVAVLIKSSLSLIPAVYPVPQAPSRTQVQLNVRRAIQAAMQASRNLNSVTFVQKAVPLRKRGQRHVSA